MDNVLICSTSSRLAGEQLFATVKQASSWILLEYPLPMGTKAFNESAIPPDVKQHLAGVLDETTNAKLLLIKRGAARVARDLKLYLVNSRQTDPFINQITFSDYHELLDLDLHKLIRRKDVDQAPSNIQPLYLICTNGKRDPCCAKLGLPTFQRIDAAPRDQIWRSSHVGGHRFAPNLVCFPHGIYYGRVDPDVADRIIRDYRHGVLSIDHYRGRAAYAQPAQAGEYFLRSQTRDYDIDAFELTRLEETATRQWEIQFVSRAEGQTHCVRISAEMSDFEVFTGCREASGTKQIQFRLADHRTC